MVDNLFLFLLLYFLEQVGENYFVYLQFMLGSSTLSVANPPEGVTNPDTQSSG